MDSLRGPRNLPNVGCRTCGKTTRPKHKSKTQCKPKNTAPCQSGTAEGQNCRTNNGSPLLTSAVCASGSHGNSLHTSTKVERRCPNRPEVEYTLDPRPPPLTLAQKLGLVEVPAPLLTECQWSQVKATSNARQDFSLPCPICQEDFGLRQQVRYVYNIGFDWMS